MNLGDLNLELHCDQVMPTPAVSIVFLCFVAWQVPRTCDNFLRLCKSGYYKGTSKIWLNVRTQIMPF